VDGQTVGCYRTAAASYGFQGGSSSFARRSSLADSA
jgi:hypothetical protein